MSLNAGRQVRSSEVKVDRGGFSPMLLLTAAVLSFVGAAFYAYGDIIQNELLPATAASFLRVGGAAWAVGFALLLAFTWLALRLRERTDDGTSPAAGLHLAHRGRAQGGHLPCPQLTHRSILAFAGIMLLCWLPYAIALYPGCFGLDTYSMINQSYPGHLPVSSMPVENPNYQFTDHHPIFDTLVYGLFARGSDLLTGSCDPGIFLLGLLQMAATAVGMVSLLAYVGRLGVPGIARLAAFVYFCALPFYPIYAFSMLKDTLHLTLMPPYAILLLETVRTHGEIYAKEQHGTRNIAAGIVLGVLLALTKKTGVYLVLIDAVVFSLAYRKHWAALLAPGIAAAVTMFAVVPLLVYPALDVAPGGVQESLGPLITQTARFVKYHGDEVTEEEREAIDAVIDYDSIALGYRSRNIDRVKYTYRWDTCTRADLQRYLRVWLAMGLRRPGTYLAATLGTCTNFFDWGGVVSVYPRAYVYPLAIQKLRITEPEALAGAREAALQMHRNAASAPFVWMLCQMALYVWDIPALAWCVAVATRSRYKLAFLPLALQIVVLFASPADLTRYALPLIWMGPVLLTMCVRRPCA